MVYVAGFVPDNGGSLIGEEQKAINSNMALAVRVDKSNCIIKIDSEKARDLFYNCCDVKYVNEALTKLQDQPLLPFLSPVTLSEQNFGSVKKFYISCLRDQAIHPIDQKRMYSKIDCSVFTLNCDHSPFFSAQEELISLLAICT